MQGNHAGHEGGVTLSIVAPVYNEEANIEKVIRYWRGVLKKDRVRGEIVVTNDGSKDKSLEILNRLKDEFDREDGHDVDSRVPLVVISMEKNGGYGMALSNSIRNSSGRYVLTIDSDGQFDAGEYRLLLERLEKDNLDLVTGYRKGKKDTVLKVFLDRVLNLLLRVMFGLKLKDTNCALKLGKGELIRGINIESKGYPTPTELIIKSSILNASIGEVGVRHFDRKGGISKLKPFRTGVNMLKFLVYLRLKIWLFKSNVISRI